MVTILNEIYEGGFRGFSYGFRPRRSQHQALVARLMKTAGKQFPVSSVAMDPVTGVTYVDYYDMFTVGAGYIDVGAALKNTDLVVGVFVSDRDPERSNSGTPRNSRHFRGFGRLHGHQHRSQGGEWESRGPGTAVTGFLPGMVTSGAINAGNAVAAQGKSDLTAAYNDAAGRPCPGPMLPGDIGGSTFLPVSLAYVAYHGLDNTLSVVISIAIAVPHRLDGSGHTSHNQGLRVAEVKDTS